MNKYLLDTNIASALINVGPVGDRVRSQAFALPPENLYLSQITVFEIRNGIEAKRFKEGRPDSCQGLEKRSEQLFQTINLVNFDHECTQQLVLLKSLGRQYNKTLSFPYFMIAATALALDATLVTNDNAFQFFDSHLTLTDWLSI